MKDKKQNGRWWQYGVAGAAGGLANGLFGAGGGLFIVPLFIGWLHMPPKRAFATSVAVVLPLCAVSLGVAWLTGKADFSGALPYLVGGAIGGALAAPVFRKLPVVWLRRLFGALVLWGGIRAVLGL